MSGFSLHPNESQTILKSLEADPAVRDQPPSPGFFDGGLDATANSLVAAIVSTKMAANTATAWLPDSFFEDDDARPREPLTAREQEFGVIQVPRSGGRENNAALANQIQDMRPDPLTTGTLGQIMYGLGSMLPQAAVGAAVGGPVGAAVAVGATTGVADYEVGKADGLDEETATYKGLLTGGTNALGALLPASFGSSILARMGTGAALNVPVGMAQRGATGALLRANGYDEMADQYEAFSGTEILIDAVAGAAFGALPNGEGGSPKPKTEDTDGSVPPATPPGTPPLGEAPQAPTPDAPLATPQGPTAPAAPAARPTVLPSDIDISLAANGMNQFELDASPGVATDAATRNAHVKAMDTAYNQMMNGEEVNVEGILDNAVMLPKPAQPEAATALRQTLEEGGYANLMQEANDLRAEAARRGIPLADDLNDPVGDVGGADVAARNAAAAKVQPEARAYLADAERTMKIIEEGKAAAKAYKAINRNNPASVQRALQLPAKPQTLLQWVRSAGGIRHGLNQVEVANLRATGKTVSDYYTGGISDLFDGRKALMRTLVKDTGLSLEDELPLMAAEEGYLGNAFLSPEYRQAQPMEMQQRFRDLLGRAIKGEAIYDVDVMNALDEAEAARADKSGYGAVESTDLELADLSNYGLDANNPTAEGIAEAMAKRDAAGEAFPGDRPTPFAQRAAEYDEIPFMRSKDVETPAFKNWFGKSKIVNPDGSPRVVYHGTDRNFEAFDPKASKATDGGHYGDGIYFALSAGEASYYGSKVGAYYLKMENPLDFDNGTDDFTSLGIFRDWAPKMKELGLLDEEATAMLEGIGKADAWVADTSHYTVFTNEQNRLDAKLVMPDGTEQWVTDYNRGYGTPDELVRGIKSTMADFYNGRVSYPMLNQYVMRWLPDGPAKVSEAAKAKGYDGILYGDELVAFEPTQIKSVDNLGTFNPDDARVMFSRPADPQDINPLGFYSQLSRVAEMKLPGKGTGADFTKALDAYAKGGDFKPEELEYSGVKEWLKTQEKVSKADVLGFLREGGVTLQEVTLADGPMKRMSHNDAVNLIAEREGITRSEVIDRWDYTNMDDYVTLAESMQEDSLEVSMEGAPDGPPKYGKYTLPGGENYREVLLTMPVMNSALANRANRERAAVFAEWEARGLDVTSARIQAPETVERLERASRMLAEAEPLAFGGQSDAVYRSSHWDQENVLAHFRLADHTDAEGNKVLLIEEIQSDWHQEGRKKGYKGAQATDPRTAKEFFGIADDDWNAMEPERHQGYLEEMNSDEEHIRAAKRAQVPDAPFKKTWAELSFKRILRMAAEKGYQKVAWTTGDIQADRFDLSKQISRVVYSPMTEMLNAFDKSNKSVLMQGGIKPEQVEDYIGKEPAKRLFEPQNTKAEFRGGKDVAYHEIIGEDLKVGGEGMKGFYDDILPKTVDKVIGKLDKAAAVGEVKIGGANEDGHKYEVVTPTGKVMHTTDNLKEAEAQAVILKGEVKEAKANTIKTHGFEMTPELRERVMLGLPQFFRASGGALPDGVESLGRGLAAEPAGTMSPDDLLVAQEVNSLVARVLPGAEVRANRRLFSTGEAGAPGEVFGAYRPLNVRESRGVIDWALEAPDAVGVARHEVIHGLKEAGLFTREEWDTLGEAAQREGWAAKHNINPAYKPNQVLEESIAEEFRVWRRADPEARAKTTGSLLHRIFSRLDLMLRRVADVARQWMGLPPNADDVFARVESGEVGNRQPVSQAEQVLADKPGMQIMDDEVGLVDGQLAMTEADAGIIRAEQFGPLHEVAVNCFLRG